MKNDNAMVFSAHAQSFNHTKKNTQTKACLGFHFWLINLILYAECENKDYWDTKFNEVKLFYFKIKIVDIIHEWINK